MRFGLTSIFACGVLCCFGVASAIAQGDAQAVTQGELRNAIYAGDINAVSSVLKTAAGRYGDEVDVEDLRGLFRVFDTSDPRTFEFTAEWLKRWPGSSHAQIARATALANAAWALRGKGSVRDIYPDAMMQFLDLNVEAFALAEQAYASDPGFLPASDAILALGVAAGSKRRAFEVLDATMRATPNWGTLERALALSDPNYGGRIGDVTFMCGLYGSMLDGPGDDTTRYCLIRAIHSYFPEGNTELLRDLLAEEPGPGLDDIRAELALWSFPGTPEEANFLRTYFDNISGADLALAIEYDRKVAFSNDYAFVQAEVGKRAKAEARKRLADDPFNPVLLDIVITDLTEVVRDEDGGVSVRLIDRVSLAARQEAARRELVASPYNPRYWGKMARVVRAERAASGSADGGLLDADPYLINAVAYSRQKPEWLRLLVSAKLEQLDRYDMAPQAFPGTDRQGDILCPLIRAAKLLEYRSHKIAPASGEGDSIADTGLEPDQIDRIAELGAAALTGGVCADVFAASPLDLYFDPVAVSLDPGTELAQL